MELMRSLESSNIGEVARAYKVIADDYTFKVVDKINKLWLYTNNSVCDLK